MEGAEIVGVVTRRRKLQFECVLFERRSGSFKFAGHDFVEGWSDQTMQVILDTVRDYIESLPGHSPNTGHSIQVYEVWGLNFPFSVRLMHRSPRKRLRRCTTSQPGTCIN